MNHTQHRSAEPDIDPALMALGGLIGGIVGVHWLAANLAAYVTHRRWPISVSNSVVALAALPRHLDEPRLAFPASILADLAGPVTYWVSVVTVLVMVLFLAVAIGSKLAGSHTEAVNRRRRLGVPTQPTLATRKDLAPLLVRRPVPDRLVLLPYRRQQRGSLGASREPSHFSERANPARRPLWSPRSLTGPALRSSAR